MHLVVSYLQYTESPVFSPVFADGLHDWGILLVIPLEFQGIKHQPFSGDAFHCAGSVAVFTAANAPLKQGQMNDL